MLLVALFLFLFLFLVKGWIIRCIVWVSLMVWTTMEMVFDLAADRARRKRRTWQETRVWIRVLSFIMDEVDDEDEDEEEGECLSDKSRRRWRGFGFLDGSPTILYVHYFFFFLGWGRGVRFYG
ncbi:hypothetical protein TorRG33x02_231480, partial [Trema orientale]